MVCVHTIYFLFIYILSFFRDDDVRRLKEQEAYLEDIRIRFRNKVLLIESYKESNKELEATIESVFQTTERTTIY